MTKRAYQFSGEETRLIVLINTVVYLPVQWEGGSDHAGFPALPLLQKCACRFQI